MINEEKDRKANPYYENGKNEMLEDDYSEESDADSTCIEKNDLID